MCRITRQKQAGLTLVEIIVVVGLLVGVVTMMLSTFLSGRASYLTMDANMIVQQESRRATDIMVRELRQAGQVSTTDADNESIQLNFQVIQGYNQAGCENTTCWGNGVDLDGWVHYAIIGNAGNERQLIRCINDDELGEIVAFDDDCSVLANYVAHPNADNSDAFVWNAATGEVTTNIEVKYFNGALPTGSVSSGVLSSTIALRN
jgi:type II secretory pathway pseudopilin PulG